MINYQKEVEKVSHIPLEKGLIKSRNTAIIVVDILNDSCREEGFFNKYFNFDISLFRNVEKNLINLLPILKNSNIKSIFTITFYDFDYISNPQKESFLKMQIPLNINFQLALKGSWGSKIVETLSDFADGIVIKSHYSAFSPEYSFFYLPNQSSYIDDYLTLPQNKDIKLIQDGKKVLKDFYNDGFDSLCKERKKDQITKDMSNNIFCNLDVYLRANQIKNLIITGGSTHVCLDATVNAASERGYKVILPIDCIASEDKDKHWIYLHNHMIFKATITNFKNLIKALK